MNLYNKKKNNMDKIRSKTKIKLKDIKEIKDIITKIAIKTITTIKININKDIDKIKIIIINKINTDKDQNNNNKMIINKKKLKTAKLDHPINIKEKIKTLITLMMMIFKDHQIIKEIIKIKVITII
jgi:hypothetical protein